jgi:hypothetical protein
MWAAARENVIRARFLAPFQATVASNSKIKLFFSFVPPSILASKQQFQASLAIY